MTSARRPTILVIDDDPLFRGLIASLLRKDYLVAVAAEGSEGFYKALEHPPDLAIVDIQMPGWDGLKTLQAFRSHAQLSKIKIVILTSDASKETVLAAIRGGANDYLIKTSFSKVDLQEKLTRLLGVRDAVPALDPRADLRRELASRAPQDGSPDAHEQSSEHESAEGLTDSSSRLQSIVDDWE